MLFLSRRLHERVVRVVIVREPAIDETVDEAVDATGEAAADQASPPSRISP